MVGGEAYRLIPYVYLLSTAKELPMKMSLLFNRWARWTAIKTGHPFVFIAALATIIIWLITGPIFKYSDTWQLVINTGTSVITFLMVFIIQNTQNKDTAAIQIKLAELIRATEGAHNALIALEELSDEELVAIHQRYCKLAEEARENLRKGTQDTNKPEVRETFNL